MGSNRGTTEINHNKTSRHATYGHRLHYSNTIKTHRTTRHWTPILCSIRQNIHTRR